MSVLSNIMGRFTKKNARKKSEEEANRTEDEASEDISAEDKKKMDVATPEGSKSMVEGDHGRIYGLSRPVVMGIGATAFLIFATAFIYASTDSGSSSNNEPKQLRESDIAKTEKRNIGELSDDYGELHRANERARSKLAAQAKVEKQQHKTTPEPPKETVPAIPAQSIPKITAPTAPVLPSDLDREAERKEKESRKSAIAFFGGNISTNTGVSENPAEKAPNEMVTSANYQGYTSNTLVAGTTFPVMLLTGINSDAPGEVVAQIMSDIYDAARSRVLVPAGSRIIGKLGEISVATGRVAITFNSIVAPDGGVWNIGEAVLVAMDGAGYSGVKGKVNRHIGSNFLGDIYSSGITALSSVSFDRVTIDSTALTSLTERQKPTTTVEPGYQFQVFATKNIDF